MKWLRKLFKKKDKKAEARRKFREDFMKYHIDINMKTMCLFEEVAEKSFLCLTTEEDILMLLYASLVSNNKGLSRMCYKTFKALVEDDIELLSWLIREYERVSKFTGQFIKDSNSKEEKDDKKILKMMDVASVLITKYRMDCRYVMYDMELWEINHYYQAIDDMTKEEYENQRLWSYIGIMPHIDSKKLNSPQQLLPFPWEKDKLKEDFEMNAKAAMGFLGGQQNG